jgi:hypothetical protein
LKSALFKKSKLVVAGSLVFYVLALALAPPAAFFFFLAAGVFAFSLGLAFSSF